MVPVIDLAHIGKLFDPRPTTTFHTVAVLHSSIHDIRAAPYYGAIQRQQ